MATTVGKVAENQWLYLILELASLSQSHACNAECLAELQVDVKQLLSDLGQSEVLFNEEINLVLQSLDVGEVEIAAFVDSTVASWGGQRCRSAVGCVELTHQVASSLLLFQTMSLPLGGKVQYASMPRLDSLGELGLGKLLTQMGRGR